MGGGGGTLAGTGTVSVFSLVSDLKTALLAMREEDSRTARESGSRCGGVLKIIVLLKFGVCCPFSTPSPRLPADP